MAAALSSSPCGSYNSLVMHSIMQFFWHSEDKFFCLCLLSRPMKEVYNAPIVLNGSNALTLNHLIKIMVTQFVIPCTRAGRQDFLKGDFMWASSFCYHIIEKLKTIFSFSVHPHLAYMSTREVPSLALILPHFCGHMHVFTVPAQVYPSWVP